MDFFANFQVVLPDSMAIADWHVEEGVLATGINVILRARNAAGERAWVKVPNRNYLEHAELPSRFAREVQMLEQLRGPWFPRYLAHGRYEAGSHHDIPWLATEPAAGEILADIIRRDTQSNTLPHPDAATRLIRSLASALVEVHGRGIVHRNLRPGCIAVSGEKIQIFDFVLGRSLSASVHTTRPNAQLGSWRYSAPEQMRDAASADGRADLFSLGVITYEYLTHQPPFPSARQAIEQATPAAPSTINPAVPPDLDQLLLSLVAPDPAERPATARDLLVTLVP